MSHVVGLVNYSSHDMQPRTKVQAVKHRVTYCTTHPTAILARGIENLVIQEHDGANVAVRAASAVLSRTIAVTLFPVVASAELVCKRIPKTLLVLNHPEKRGKRCAKVKNLAYGILASPLALYSAEAPSSLFLKVPSERKMVRPFGVEGLFAKRTERVLHPSRIEDLQAIVVYAKEHGKTISIIGAGMSQGTQTTPRDEHQIVVHLHHFKTIEIDRENNKVKAGAGVTWQKLQLELNRVHKSAIVKQASDIFSIGGSIGINCHGWAHNDGAIASTVESMTIVNAEGQIQVLTRSDELFGCMFGTLGYFGAIVDATLRIVDNDWLEQETREMVVDDFCQTYRADPSIPLLGGRLTLDGSDSEEGAPLGRVYLQTFKKTTRQLHSIESHFVPEKNWGTRSEKVGLAVYSWIPQKAVPRFVGSFWASEKRNMLKPGMILPRNEVLHPPINAMRIFHKSNLHAEWLQEYFIAPERLSAFLTFLGRILRDNQVRLLNATIRPVQKDEISILPYAERMRHAVVLCFAQMKTKKEIAKTEQWIKEVNQKISRDGDVYYQAYMPYATREQFETCYGKERVEKMRELKRKYDPQGVFGNGHTAKYFDKEIL